ncbi:hypothetical protein KMZ93_09800 [Bradyrhizobium sediminis]|uniref:Chemotaxis protein CheZ n=1 Tax=Bradyrhizobium sediminis TaxID=2840469 RepID=A0A975RYU5_9BRAD|nr:hypothetical protein [Bradyrhizobium sediminis]QWG25140.1 hypothetical protein KMZ93_09800 [Bradyrhizobium sediminis]
MADEAFALSPISARATQPSEEDYDAISQAFMETSRGRWFLGEYAKRNRNADTRMVLDAVARIEDSLAAQRQPQPAPDNGLAEALAAIRNTVDEARGASAAALDGLALEDKLAPVRKGARIIREISWRWREIGADGRICDLLDSQVAAIEGACGQIASVDPRTELGAAFDLIAERIAELGDGDIAPTVEAVSASPAPAPTAEMSAAVETAEVAMAEDIVEAAMTSPAAQDDEVAAAAGTADIAATAVATVEAEVIADEAADADDDAILDMIALEMAAEDPYDADDALEIDADETHVAELASADPIVVAEEPEPIAAAAEPQAVEPPLQASPEASAEPEPSLGSTLIASGILQRPKMTAADPFAPIRRMSQAEKIAFFS